MKTIIGTLVVAFFLSIPNSFAGGKLYKNVIEDKEKHTVTTTVCKGENDMNLIPLTECVLQYNTDGSLKERISYKWESRKKTWVAYQKYMYEYDKGSLTAISYVEWNKSTKAWGNDIQYVMYVYDSKTDLLTVTSNSQNK